HPDHRAGGRTPADRRRLGRLRADLDRADDHGRRGGGDPAAVDAVLQVRPDPRDRRDGGAGVMTRRTLALATILALLAALIPGTALGQTAAPPSAAATPSAAETLLTFAGAGATRVKTQLALTAKLASADGKPLSNQSIDFYQQV